MHPQHSAPRFPCDCAHCMRGGRTEPRMVSRTTYNAHANARLGPIGSFTGFVDEQRQTAFSAGGGTSGGDLLRGRSLSVSPLPSGSAGKRLQTSPDLDTQPTNKRRTRSRSRSAESEHAQHNIKQEDLDEGLQDFGGGNGQMPPLFGNTGGRLAAPMDLDENHVCSIMSQLTYCL